MELCIKACIPIIAVIAIAIVECFAIEHGIDGTVLLLSLCAVAGIGGYNLKPLLDKIKGNKDAEK
jgi:hypothetical protein